MSSSLLLFQQRFGRYVFQPSSGVCRTWEPSHGTSNYVLYLIHGGRCSDSCIVTRLQSGLNLQPPVDCVLREPTPITVTLCALMDSSGWIFGTYKLNVLINLMFLLDWAYYYYVWFFTCVHNQIFFNFMFPTKIALTTKHPDIVIWCVKAKNGFRYWVNGPFWRKFRQGTSA